MAKKSKKNEDETKKGISQIARTPKIPLSVNMI